MVWVGKMIDPSNKSAVGHKTRLANMDCPKACAAGATPKVIFRAKIAATAYEIEAINTSTAPH